jgi:hypothetical protein
MITKQYPEWQLFVTGCLGFALLIGLLYLVNGRPSPSTKKYDIVRVGSVPYYAKPESIKSDGNVLYFKDENDALVQVKGTWTITFAATKPVEK